MQGIFIGRPLAHNIGQHLSRKYIINTRINYSDLKHTIFQILMQEYTDKSYHFEVNEWKQLDFGRYLEDTLLLNVM